MALSACYFSPFISTRILEACSVVLCFWEEVEDAGGVNLKAVELQKKEFAVAVVLGACVLRLRVFARLQQRRRPPAVVAVIGRARVRRTATGAVLGGPRDVFKAVVGLGSKNS